MRFRAVILLGLLLSALSGGRAACAGAPVPADTAAHAAASAPSGHATVAFQPTSWGAPVVPVRVNGRVTAQFLLDTGYGTSFVSPDLVKRLGLKERAIVMGGRSGSAATLDRLQIGGAVLRDAALSAPVTDLSSLSQVSGQIVDGILGADALAGSAVAIDFPQSRITAWNHGSLSPEEVKRAGFASACVAPLDTPDGGGSYSVSTTVINGDRSRTVDLAVATGAPFDILPRADLEAVGGDFLPLWDQPDLQVARVSGLCIGTASVTAPLLRIASADDRPTLGLRTLIRFRVLLDGPGRKLYLAPAVSVAPPPSGRDGLRVPFRFGASTSHFVIVRASVDGHAPLPFILDTGVTLPLVLDSAAAKKLGVALDKARISRMNGVLPATSGAISSLVLPGSTPRDSVRIALSQAWVRDLGPLRHILPGEPLAGIIGAGVLRDAAVKIDFAARVLTIYPGALPSAADEGAVALPFAAAAHPDSYFVSLAPSGEKPVTLSLDTGSWNTIAPRAAAADWRPKAVCGSGGWAFGSLTLGENFWIPRFALGSAVASDVDVTVAPIDAAMPWLPGILGLNALSQFTVTLDIPNSRLLLQPSAEGRAAAYRTGWTGIFLATKGSAVRVREVVPKSPAARAGVRAGDTILAVDGRSAAGLGLFAVRDLVLGRAGTQASLRLRAAGGKTRMVRFRRLSQYDAPRGPLFGLFGHQRGAAPLQVDDVESPSPAARAGIRKGDTIVAIDGHHLSTLTADQFFEVSPRRVTLTVRPGGDGKPRTVSLTAADWPRPAHTPLRTSARNARGVAQPAN